MGYNLVFGHIPTMADYLALTLLLSALVKKENLAKFNCFGDSNGRINIRIQLYGSDENIDDLPRMSLRNKSDKQLKRNQNRAYNWRESLPSNSQNNSKMDLDNSSENIYLQSETGPDVLNLDTNVLPAETQSSVDVKAKPVNHNRDSLPKQAHATTVDSHPKSSDRSESKQPRNVNKTSENTQKAPTAPTLSTKAQATIQRMKARCSMRSTTTKSAKSPQSTIDQAAKARTSGSTQTQKACSISWCEVGNVPTCCSCSESSQCDYCTGAQIDKMCKRCQDSQYSSGSYY